MNDEDDGSGEGAGVETASGELLWNIATGEEPCDDPTLMREARAYACIRLRQQAMPYREIAAFLGISQGSAHLNVRRAVQAVMKDDVKDYHALNVMRLEGMLAGLMDRATEGDTFAIQGALAVMAKLDTALGIQPPKQRVEHTFTEDTRDDARDALAKAIAGLTPPGDGSATPEEPSGTRH